MKSRIHNELNRELKNVRVSRELKGSILAAAAEERFPEKRRGIRLAPLAAAAAVIVICGLTLGMISLRAEKIDRRSTVLSSGSGEWVWVGDQDDLYHSVSPCGDMSGAVRVRLELAKQDSRTPCDRCMAGTAYTPVPEEGFVDWATTALPEMMDAESLVWATAGGMYYHSEEHCSGMREATQMSFEEAEAMGKTACPTCIGEWKGDWEIVDEQPLVSPTPEPVEATPEPRVISGGDVVWSTAGGRYYHCDEHCSGMQGAVQMTFAEALSADKSACPVCYGINAVADASAAVEELSTPEPTPMPADVIEARLVWATTGGMYYHRTENCSGMRDALRWSLEEVMEIGKVECPVCFHGMDAEYTPVPARVTPEPTPMPTVQSNGITAWATKSGRYYHSIEDCSGMQGASLWSFDLTMTDKEKCPVCYSQMEAACTPVPEETDGGEGVEEAMVWATQGGGYYHLDGYCSGMRDAEQWAASDALAAGKAECPVCFGEADGESAAEPEASGRKEMMIWATQGGNYYHLDEHCSGMQGAEAILLEEALAADKTKCPVCFSEKDAEPEAFGEAYYSTGGSAYFHAVPDCSGMENAQWFFDFELQEMGKEPCPVCLVLGEDSWAETIAEGSLSLSLCRKDGQIVLECLPETKLEWLDYGLSRPVDTNAAEVRKALDGTATECMTTAEAAELEERLKAGWAVGFRCIRYNLFFEDEALEAASTRHDDGDGDVRRYMLVSDVQGEGPEALNIGVIATEIACVFGADGSVSTLTGTVAMTETGREEMDEGELIYLSQERVETIFPTILADVPVEDPGFG